MMVPHILVTVILLTELRIADSIQPIAELTQRGNGEIVNPTVETTESERVGKRVTVTYLRHQILTPTNKDILKWTNAIVPYVKDSKPDGFPKNALAVKSFHFLTDISNTHRSYTNHRSRVYDDLGKNHQVISKRSVQSDVAQGTVNPSTATTVPVGYSTSDTAIAPDVNIGSTGTAKTEPAITTSSLTVTVTSNAIHETSKATSNSVHPDWENNANNNNNHSTNSIATTNGANIISQYSHNTSTVSNYDTHDNVYYTSAIQTVTNVQTTTTSSSETTVTPSTSPSVTASSAGGQSDSHTPVSTPEILIEDITHEAKNNTTTIASTNITESLITTTMPSSTVHVQDHIDPSYDASHTSAHYIDTSTKRYTPHIPHGPISVTTPTSSVNISPDTIISETSSSSYVQYSPSIPTDNASNSSASDKHIQTVVATTTAIKTPKLDDTTSSVLLTTFIPASTTNADNKTSRAHELTGAVKNTTKPPTTNHVSATPSLTTSDISINISTKGSPAVEHVEGNLTTSAKLANVSIGTSPDNMTTVPTTWVISAEPVGLESSSAEPTDSPTASSSTSSNLTTIISSTEHIFVASTEYGTKVLSDDDEDADAVGTPEPIPSTRVYHNKITEAEILNNADSTSTSSQYSVYGHTDSVSAAPSSKTSTTDSYSTTDASTVTLTETEGSVALNSLRPTTRVHTTADVIGMHTTTTSSNTVAATTTNYPLELTKLHTDSDAGTAMHSSEKTTTKTSTSKHTTVIVPIIVTNTTYIHTNTTLIRSNNNPKTSEQPETLPSTLSTITEAPSSKVKPTTEILHSTLKTITYETTTTLVPTGFSGSEPGIPDPEPPPIPEPEVGTTAITYDTSEATTSTLSDHTTDARSVWPVSHPDKTIGRDDPDVEADNGPELDPDGESKAEAEPEPEPEVEPEEDPEPDPFAEPGPDWDVAKFEFKHAWQFHVYFFGSCFVLLCVYCLVSVLRLWKLEHLLSRRYFLTLNMLVVCVCLFRAFYLLVDAYNSNGTFPVVMDYFVYNTVFPFITAAFSILFFALLLATRVRTMSSKVQRLSVLLTIIALHFCLSVATDVVVGLFSSGQVMLLVCQFFFILWGLLMFIGYLIVFSRIHRTSALRHTPNARRADERNRGTSHDVPKTMVSKQRYTIGLAAKVTLASAVFGLGYIGIELYSIFGVYGILRTTRPAPWPWYIHHTITRILELLMCSSVAYVAAQPFKYNYRKGKRKMIYALPCKLILCCENGKDRADGDFSTFSMDHYIASESEDARRKHKHKRAQMGPPAAPYPPHTAERYTDPDATLLVRRIQPSMLVVEDGFVRIRRDDDAVPIQHCELDSNSKSSGVSMNSRAELGATNGGFTHRHTAGAADEGLANIAYAQDDVRGRIENGDICYRHRYTANVPTLDTGETTTSNNVEETDTDTHSSASGGDSADLFRPLSMIDLAASMESELEKAFHSSFVDNTDLISHNSLPASLEIHSSDSNEFVCNEGLYEKYGEDDVDPYAYLESPSYSSDSAENQFNPSGMKLIETPVRRSNSVELTKQAKVKLFHNHRYLSLTDVERIEQEDHQA